MRGFDERFEKARRDFDRDFNRAKKFGIIWGVFTLTLTLGLIGFGIWVVVMLLQFFGVM